MKALLTAILVLVLSSAESPCWADDPRVKDKRAAGAFFEGQDAFAAGDFRRAGAAFEAAYALRPHHDALWNAAQSWRLAGDDLRAANLLDQYLREAPPNARDRDAATAALVDVGRRVGRLQLELVPSLDPRIDGASATRSITYVAPGEHVVTATEDGRPIRRVVVVRGGENPSVALAREDVGPPSAASRPLPHAAARGWSPWTVVVGGAVVAAGGVLTVLSGLDTVDKRDVFLADRTQDKLDIAFASQTRTNVLLASTAGIALLTGAVAAFLVEWHGSARSGGPAERAPPPGPLPRSR